MMGRLLELQEQWRCIFSMRSHHWRRVGSRATTRTSTRQGRSGTTSSPLPFTANSEGHRHLPSKETQTTIDFNPFLLLNLIILYFPSSSRFVFLYWWQIRPLVLSPNLLRGVESIKKSQLMRKGAICEWESRVGC